MRDIVYSEKLSTFNDDIDRGLLNIILKKKLAEKGIGVSLSQDAAFTNSLTQLSNIFGAGKIDQDYYCAIEYVIFSSHKRRIDFMLSGFDKNNVENVIILELKQWSNDNVKVLPYSDNLEAMVSQGVYEETNHPSAQAMSYRNLFNNYYAVVEEDPIIIHSASFLHNYLDTPHCAIKDSRFDSLLQISPTFLKTDNQKLREYVKLHLNKPDDGKIFKRLDGSDLKPTYQLKNSIKSLILNNNKLSLFDSQLVAYNAIIAKVKESLVNYKKSVFIIEGGPGTGKSLVALKILGTVINDLSCTAYYATHNSAVRYLFQNSITDDESKGIHELLAWSGEWVRSDRDANSFDCVVVDEAHRLQTSVQGARGTNLSIINEIIKSARVSVFFIDEGQFVTYRDVGTIEAIRDAASENNAEVIMKDEFKLETQFRCNGSDGYIAFLDYVINGTMPEFGSYKFNYDLHFVKTGQELCDNIFTLKMNGENARLVAGYAYEWKKDPNNPDVAPLNMPWNKDTKTWATRNDGFNEVGCVFSAQGAEFDYVGVLIGKDLVLNKVTNKIEPNVYGHAESDHTYMRAKFNKTPSNIKKANKFILNSYKILLTRGIRGCYIYCEDSDLQEYLESEWKAFVKKYSN